MNADGSEQPPVTQVNLDLVVEKLCQAGQDLPEAAMRIAQAHSREITPRLIEVIRRAVDDARTGDWQETSGPFLALFLLTEFRAKEALPVVLEALSLPGELPESLFGDAITSALPSMFIGMSDSPLETINSVMSNSELNLYVRWGAADCYCYLVRDGAMTREEAVDQLRGHLRKAIDSRDTEFIGPIITELIQLHPVEARDDIEEAYRLNLVEVDLITLDQVKSDFERGEEGMRKDMENLPPTQIDDTVEELLEWASFQEQSDIPEPRMTPPTVAASPLLRTSPTSYASRSLTKSAPVGRNEPCPCGSGKKYKKCCGSPKAAQSRPR